MSPEQQAEAVELQRQMHAYFDSLSIAGIPDQMIVSAAVIAAAERVLMASTPTQTAAWLHGMGHLAEKHGAEMKAARMSG